MGKLIVTSGQPFTDIDALACAVAYTELLNLKGKSAQVVLPGPLNKSITESVKKWLPNIPASITLQPTGHISYILVDISDPEFFADFVNVKNIIEIFDHRYGFEEYWKKILGQNSHIEMVGSCATLIWEEFVNNVNPVNISELSANLLYTAMLSNTLNFKASITTSRDINAFNQIEKYTHLPNNWIKIYFEDQNKEILENVKETILNDTKNISGPVIGQIELWDSRELFDKHLDEIEATMKSFGKDEWYMTSPSISEGINYLFTKNQGIKKLLEKTIDAKFVGDIGKTKKLWLRKEIVKKFSEGS